LEFDVPIGTAHVGKLGDSFDRFWVRIREMQESCKILRQCLKMMPKGPAIAKVPRKFRPPAGECYAASKRRAVTWAFTSSATAASILIASEFAPVSFYRHGIIDKLSKGIMLADLIALIGSLDVDAPEIDR